MKPHSDPRMIAVYVAVLGIGGHAVYSSYETTLSDRAVLIAKQTATKEEHEEKVEKLEGLLSNAEALRKKAEDSLKEKSSEISALQVAKRKQESELKDLQDQLKVLASAPVSESEAGISSGEKSYSPGNFRLDTLGFRSLGNEARSGGRTWHHFRGPGTTSLIVEVEPNNSEDPTRRMKRVESEMSRENYEQLSMVSYSTFKGMDAAIWEFSDLQDGRQITKLILYTKSGTTGYRLIAVADQSEWSSRKETFGRIMNSFSVD